MKIHRPLVEQIFLSLEEIFATSRPADKVIEKTLKSHREWGSRDRRFVAENIYGVVRHWRRLWVEAGLSPIHYLHREAINAEAVKKVWAVFHLESGGDWPEWLESRFRPPRFREGPVAPAPARTQLTRAEQQSIPDWLDEVGASRFGDSWGRLLSALNQVAPVDLRANTLKTNREYLQRRLLEEGIETQAVAGVETALRLNERKNVFVTKAFREGLFEVQDVSSQKVAPLLAPEPGQRVVDACAGAGGKSLHLAALMKNKGKILSLDIHEWKLKELRTRASRAGVDVIETRLIDSKKVIKRMEETADRVLLDVPCSGLGVLRRNPDSKWRLSPEEISRLLQLQREILGDYSRICKIGGRLVYATCSVLPDENEKQVEAFLASDEGQGWSLIEQHFYRPDQNEGDGFFAALLQRS